MKLAKYQIAAESSYRNFGFVSEGTKGAIRKIIQFQETSEANLYNLAFGDRHPEIGALDDLIVSDNGDSEKVLATVVGALYVFFDHYPNAFVYAQGSTAARTRLYRMGITRFYDEAKRDFLLYGRMGVDFQLFELGRAYDGFLVRRKTAYL